MKDRILKVIQNVKIADSTYRMVLHTEDFESMKGGQFIHIALPDATKQLRRPFCIADYDTVAKTITVVYAVVGGGTEELSKVREGANLKALFPLGNGFTLDESVKKVVLLGGGLGAAVLPAIPTTWQDKEYYTFLGFCNKDKAILVGEMKAKSKAVYVATDDGSLGEKGFVTTLLKDKLKEINPDVILCCGPEVMYQTLAKQFDGCGIPIFVSLEKRMGCGVGACLVCNCKVKTADGEKFLRACVDGPVFNLSEVVL